MRSNDCAGSSRTGNSRTRRWRSRFATLSTLVLLSAGCSTWLSKPEPTPEPPPKPSPRSECRKGNQDEWTGFFVLTEIAKAQQTKGDKFHVALAVSWIGDILAGCFPENVVPVKPPVVAPKPAPPAASAPPADAKPPAK